MKLEKQKSFLIQTAFWAVVLVFGIAVIKIGGVLLFPFLLGFLIAFLLKMPINFACEKMKINRKLVSIVLLVLFYLTLGCVVIVAGDRIISEIRQLIYQLPQKYTTEVEPVLNIAIEKIQTMFFNVFGNVKGNFSNLPNNIASIVTSISRNALITTTDLAAKIPSFFLNTLLMIISSFFFTLDYHKITAAIFRQFSPKVQELIIAIKNSVVVTIGNYLKAYSIIILCTTIELFIGLSLLRVENAFILALLIALIDILPVLGTGIVLIPWAVIGFIAGNTKKAVGLLILYFIILIVRQILEPKVVGNQVGLPSILILISMYAGVKLFGAIGIFLLPILLTIVKNLNDAGTIHLFK